MQKTNHHNFVNEIVMKRSRIQTSIDSIFDRFLIIVGTKIRSKSVAKRSERALNEDSDSMLNKYRSESVALVLTRVKLEVFGASGGGTQGGGQHGFTRPRLTFPARKA